MVTREALAEFFEKEFPQAVVCIESVGERSATLRKPAADKDVIARCKLIKVGRILVVGEVSLFSDGESEPVAHAVGTCSIPPQRQEGAVHEPAG